MDDFERELKVGFLDEAAVAVEEAEQCFLQLESNSEDPETIAKIFRLAHNLKGSSKAVGFDDMGEFTHHFENLLLRIKDGTLSVNAGITDLLLKCLDHVKMMIEKLREDLDARFDSKDLLHEIEGAIQGKLSGDNAKASAAEAMDSSSANSFGNNPPSADAFIEDGEPVIDFTKGDPTIEEILAAQAEESFSVPQASAFGDEESAPAEMNGQGPGEAN